MRIPTRPKIIRAILIILGLVGILIVVILYKKCRYTLSAYVLFPFKGPYAETSFGRMRGAGLAGGQGGAHARVTSARGEISTRTVNSVAAVWSSFSFFLRH